jgi:N-methylhydantoinase B
VLKTSGIELDAGDEVISTAGGGGGYGDPLDRTIEEVRMDAVNGYVPLESAKRDYGVILDPETLDVDLISTRKIRQDREQP